MNRREVFLSIAGVVFASQTALPVQEAAEVTLRVEGMI